MTTCSSMPALQRWLELTGLYDSGLCNAAVITTLPYLFW